ncbi:MAG: hypothetical protein Q8M57_02685 [Nitrosomonas sp.]|uniref:hypothetical protein n=1 Tax=Nitrosomonas sp. TaxID=42353 RepID=UPI0027356C14|nr:hypothetical protein [Nitrosomonas sp.]MDP3279948.1 hypothetical protein [Nitrosomonas sp.]
MSNSNGQPSRGFALKLRQSCGLGARNKLISMHNSALEAEAAAKSLNYDLAVFEILDIYNNRTLTSRV